MMSSQNASYVIQVLQVYLMNPDQTTKGCGSINALMSLMGKEFAPHGSNGFKYTNQTHKLGMHPSDPTVLVMEEHADSAVLVARDGKDVAGTEKSDITILSMFQFNDQAKIQMIVHKYDQAYFALCEEKATESYAAVQRAKKRARRPPPPTMDFPTFEPIEFNTTSTAEIVLPEVTRTTTTETLMPDGSIKVVVDDGKGNVTETIKPKAGGTRSDMTAFLQADIENVKAKFSAGSDCQVEVTE